MYLNTFCCFTPKGWPLLIPWCPCIGLHAWVRPINNTPYIACPHLVPLLSLSLYLLDVHLLSIFWCRFCRGLHLAGTPQKNTKEGTLPRSSVPETPASMTASFKHMQQRERMTVKEDIRQISQEKKTQEKIRQDSKERKMDIIYTGRLVSSDIRIMRN